MTMTIKNLIAGKDTSMGLRKNRNFRSKKYNRLKWNSQKTKSSRTIITPITILQNTMNSLDKNSTNPKMNIPKTNLNKLLNKTATTTLSFLHFQSMLSSSKIIWNPFRGKWKLLILRLLIPIRKFNNKS